MSREKEAEKKNKTKKGEYMHKIIELLGFYSICQIGSIASILLGLPVATLAISGAFNETGKQHKRIRIAKITLGTALIIALSTHVFILVQTSAIYSYLD